MLRRLATAAGLSLAIAAAGAASAAPQRVVSINLCADTLALELLPRSHIRSVSFLAADPAYSTVVDRVGDIPLNQSRVEEVARFHPDLVLASNLTSAVTVTALRRLGYRVAIVRAPDTLTDVYSIIRSTAALLGVPARGERLLDSVNRTLAEAEPAPGGNRPVAVFYGANGYSVGAGTLQDDLLHAAGFRNLAAELGIRGGGRLSIERLLAGHPAVVILDDFESHKPSLAERRLRQPALREGLADAREVRIAPKYWMCANADIARVVRQLAALR